MKEMEDEEKKEKREGKEEGEEEEYMTKKQIVFEREKQYLAKLK